MRSFPVPCIFTKHPHNSHPITDSFFVVTPRLVLGFFTFGLNNILLMPPGCVANHAAFCLFSVPRHEISRKLMIHFCFGKMDDLWMPFRSIQFHWLKYVAGQWPLVTGLSWCLAQSFSHQTGSWWVDRMYIPALRVCAIGFKNRIPQDGHVHMQSVFGSVRYEQVFVIMHYVWYIWWSKQEYGKQHLHTYHSWSYVDHMLIISWSYVDHMLIMTSSGCPWPKEAAPYPCCLAPLREAFFDGVAIGQWHPALRVVHQGLFENEQNASFWDTVYWYNLVCTY